jgi:hypothetical protein
VQVIFGLSYRFRPGYKFVSSPQGIQYRDYLRAKSSLFRRGEAFVEKTVQRISSNRIVQPITDRLGINAADVMMASAEVRTARVRTLPTGEEEHDSDEREWAACRAQDNQSSRTGCTRVCSHAIASHFQLSAR